MTETKDEAAAEAGAALVRLRWSRLSAEERRSALEPVTAARMAKRANNEGDDSGDDDSR